MVLSRYGLWISLTIHLNLISWTIFKYHMWGLKNWVNYVAKYMQIYILYVIQAFSSESWRFMEAFPSQSQNFFCDASITVTSNHLLQIINLLLTQASADSQFQFTHCFFLLTFHFLLLWPITWLSLFPRAKSRGRFAWPKWSPPSVASLSTGVFGSDVHPWCHHLQPETGEQISCCLNMGLSPLAGTGRKVLWGCCANLESGAWKAVWRER